MSKLLCLVALLFNTPAWAADPILVIKGFGNAGAVRADSSSYYLNEFDTFGTRTNFTQNTRLGFNLSSKISEEWSVASQFIAERRQLGYSAVLDWGFVSYQPIPELAIRAGRLIAGTWLFSQQLKVGYSYLWVRPPVEVYSLLAGFTNLNGVSLLSNIPLGSGELSAEVYGGAEDGKSYVNNPSNPAVSDIRVSDLIGADFTYSYKDFWSLHASYLQSHADVKVSTQVGISGTAFGTIQGTHVIPLDLHFGRFFSFGGKMDYKNIIFISEFARRLIKGQSLQSASAWYATLGYRISKVTPYFNYAWQGSLRGSQNTHPNTPTVSTLKKGMHSYLLGVNAQVHDSVIVKGEWQQANYKYLDGSANFKVNVASLSASFIF